MKKSHACRSTFLTASLLGCVLSASVAHAADEVAGPDVVLGEVPLDVPLVDERGVSILYGTIKPHMEISMGSGAGAVTVSATYPGKDSELGILSYLEVPSDTRMFDGDGVLHLGNEVIKFDGDGYLNFDDYMGWSLQYYSVSDTMVAVDPSGNAYNLERDSSASSDRFLVKSISSANGINKNYSYKCIFTVRQSACRNELTSIKYSNGFEVLVDYWTYAEMANFSDYQKSILKVRSIKIVNNAYVYCPDNAYPCDTDSSWPSISFSFSGAGADYDVTIERNDGRQIVLEGPNVAKIHQSGMSDIDLVYSGPYVNPDSHIDIASFQQGGLIWSYSNIGSGESSHYINEVLDPDGGTRDYYYAMKHLDSWSPSGCGGCHTSAHYRSLVSSTDELGRVTSYTWTGGGVSPKLQKVIFPGGASREYLYDDRGNIYQVIDTPKAGSGDLPSVRYYNYPSECTNRVICNKPSSYQDVRGFITSYSYDASHGGILTQVAPAVDGVSPARKYTYVQRYAWVKGSGSGYVHAANPVWLLSEVRSCATSSLNLNNGSCAGGVSDLLVTAYDYGPDSGPNNLFVRGMALTSAGVTLRTCYTYDKWGRKISETQPRADLSSCS